MRPSAALALLPALLLATGPAGAEDFDRHSEHVQGNVSVAVDVTGTEDDGYTANLSVSEDGKPVLAHPVTEIFSPIGLPEISFVEMDKGNDTPEIFVANWTGGAHCCTAISVFTKTAGGWVALPAGAFDGEPMTPTDADGDGQAEIVTVDNAFLYRFSSYAGSYAPPQVTGLRNGAMADISAEPGFRPLFTAYLTEMGEMPAGGPDRNSWLAARTAALLRLGEADALALAEDNFDKAADWGLESCQVEMTDGVCPPGKETKLTFPEALGAFLTEQGYLEANR